MQSLKAHKCLLTTLLSLLFLMGLTATALRYYPLSTPCGTFVIKNKISEKYLIVTDSTIYFLSAAAGIVGYSPQDVYIQRRTINRDKNRYFIDDGGRNEFSTYIIGMQIGDAFFSRCFCPPQEVRYIAEKIEKEEVVWRDDCIYGAILLDSINAEFVNSKKALNLQSFAILMLENFAKDIHDNQLDIADDKIQLLTIDNNAAATASILHEINRTIPGIKFYTIMDYERYSRIGNHHVRSMFFMQELSPPAVVIVFTNDNGLIVGKLHYYSSKKDKKDLHYTFECKNENGELSIILQKKEILNAVYSEL